MAKNKSRKGGDQSQNNLAFFMYLILPIEDASRLLLHNLVMELFTGGFLIYTFFVGREISSKFLGLLRLVAAGFAGFAALHTVYKMFQGSASAEDSKKTMAFINVLVALMMIVISVISIVTRTEQGALLGADLFITITNLFWVWRNAQIAF